MLHEKFEIHDNLNPKLWENNKLKTDVKEKILETVKEFVDNSRIPIDVSDIHVVGSQASFNYTDKSDLDVHIISNFDLFDCDSEIVQIACDAIKAKFNSDYNISIHGIDVELYVEDIRSSVASNGIYSVLTDRWVKFPKPITNVPVYEIDSDVLLWKNRIDKCIVSKNIDELTRIFDDLYLMRKDAIAKDGEYARDNQIFKELRNDGYVDKIKLSYKELKSKQLSLESWRPLQEDSRSSLLSRSKSTQKGFQRYKKRVKSRIANSVKQYNAIDMNKLFKQDILDVDISVTGETDSYVVKISFGGFCEMVQKEIEKQQGVFNYKAVTRALIRGFNQDDVYISCNCSDWKYRFNYYATKNNITSGDPENRPSDITNPEDKLGPACKHVLLVLSNTSWLLKVSSTIYNYVNYMQKHYQKLYADIIYPAIYGKTYEDPVQMDMFDDTLQTDSETIDNSNEYARTKNQFKIGNTQGVRFGSNKTPQQVSFEDET
jgi:hypothetical protein